MRTRTIRRLVAAAALAGVALLGPSGARAEVPPTITNQGRLFDANDQPIQGPLTVLFAIYDAENAQAPIWSEEQSVTFEDGYYSVSLGSVVPFGDTVFDGSLRWFGITIGDGAELLPRAPVQSVPYALLAQD